MSAAVRAARLARATELITHALACRDELGNLWGDTIERAIIDAARIIACGGGRSRP